MNKIKKVYLIGIGGIGVSALARHYLSAGWQVLGSDSTSSELIKSLISEGCDIIIGQDALRINSGLDLVIHTEAIPENNEELQKAKKLGIKTLKYNLALAEIANSHKLIAISGTHGKSTTSSMISIILKKSTEDFTCVVGTLLKEFNGNNYFTRGKNNYFVIEACEHKEHFLAYRPSVAVITNIEYDHADYFKTPKDYLLAFEKFIDSIVPNGFCVINGDDENCISLIGKRKDIHYIVVKKESYYTIFPGENHESNTETYPEIVMHVPGEHIMFDAKLAFIVSHMIGIPEVTSLESLEEYSGVWRRMEIIGETANGNILMSDYGHHPTEIKTTLDALKSGYPNKKIFVVFQPHQYSRTIELLDDFKTCFKDADTLIIPNIYESRDSDKNKAAINTAGLVESIKHNNVHEGNGLDNTFNLIQKYDQDYPSSSIILLLGAGDIDNLRYKIKTS